MNKVKLVFLGDYVDRGTNSVETLAYLLSLKVMYPERITLLMGNHELTNYQAINESKGPSSHFYLREDIKNVYGEGDDYVQIQKGFCGVLLNLPIAAIIDGSIYCAHGGIPRFMNEEDLVYFMTAMVDLKMKDIFKELNNIGVYDVVSSDPLEKGRRIPPNGLFPPGFYVSPRVEDLNISPLTYPSYPCGFSDEAIKEFLRITGCKKIVRAHQHSGGHYSIRCGGDMLTVFTSTELMKARDGKFYANIVVWNGKGLKIIALSNEEARKRLVRKK